MSTRDRILDAAATVLRDRGVARATTKEIAREAGCSEALLYKYFTDKQELFLGVLAERAPHLSPPDSLVGSRTVTANLTELVRQLIDFYTRSFPMAASIFGAPELLAAHRAGMRRLGAGPDAPARRVQTYLDAESARGRIAAGVDTEAAARTLTGAALLEAFLVLYDGADEVPDAERVAERIVATVPLTSGTAPPPR